MKIDIVVDCSAGDCAKAKVVNSLLKKNNYDFVIRGNGANNAGHTLYHQDKKFITHSVPGGVFHSVRSIIGPGCVVHPGSFLQELRELDAQGIPASRLTRVSEKCHIITEEHLVEDQKDSKIGTTRRGVGGAYRDKYGRTGIQAKDIPELKPFLVDFYEEIFSYTDPYILYESAQGFWLDPNFAKFPFCTSSHCTVGGALSNGLPWNKINKVYGCFKPYFTWVSALKIEPDEEIFKKIREKGSEFGSTTGRPRQCALLNVNKLKQAVEMNGITDLICNKMDVLRDLDYWWIATNGGKVNLKTEDNFKNYLNGLFKPIDIKYSYSALDI